MDRDAAPTATPTLTLTDDVVEPPGDGLAARPLRTPRLARLDWLWADTRAKVALSWILLVLAVAILAPVIAPQNPIEQN
jgi:hypothetical protein